MIPIIGFIRFLTKTRKNTSYYKDIYKNIFYNKPNNTNIVNKPNNSNNTFNNHIKQGELEKDRELPIEYEKIDSTPISDENKGNEERG